MFAQETNNSGYNFIVMWEYTRMCTLMHSPKFSHIHIHSHTLSCAHSCILLNLIHTHTFSHTHTLSCAHSCTQWWPILTQPNLCATWYSPRTLVLVHFSTRIPGPLSQAQPPWPALRTSLCRNLSQLKYGCPSFCHTLPVLIDSYTSRAWSSLPCYPIPSFIYSTWQ